MRLYDRIIKPKRIELPSGHEVYKPASRAPLVIVILLVMTLVSARVTGFSLRVIIERIGEFFVIIGRMIPPDFTFIDQIWEPLMQTIKMSLLGTTIGALAAIPFAMLASTNVIKNRIVVPVIRLFLSLVRTLPTLISALIATYIFGLGTLAGTTAIAIYSFAYIGKLTYEDIETVDMGPFEAMEAMGASRVKSFVSSIIPQVFPTYLSNCLYCFEGNVRYAAILGYVGAGGIGLIISENVAWREYANVGMILLTLYVTVFIIESTSRAARKRLV